MSSQCCGGESGLPALCAPALNGACGIAYPCAVAIATQQRLFSGKLKAAIAASSPPRGGWGQLLLLDPIAMETMVHHSGHGCPIPSPSSWSDFDADVSSKIKCFDST